MKELTRVHCSKGVLGLLSGLKSRIHSIKSAFTTLALLMVCLFGVNEEAWGGTLYGKTAVKDGKGGKAKVEIFSLEKNMKILFLLLITLKFQI